jgi:choline-sulfatase
VRILYIDVDSLRADHLGCYGYHRATTPNIDLIARDAVIFQKCYISDAPCLPSRTALWSGRFGFHTGVVNHGGTAAQPFVEGPTRSFQDTFGRTSWMQALRTAGLRTATVSSFAGRHGAWHWYAGYRDMLNPGLGGLETAESVNLLASDWLRRHAREDQWFLHVNYWDPHTPYRTPLDYGDPFAGQPLAAWLTEEVRERCWNGYGPHSAQEPTGNGFQPRKDAPRVPVQLDSMEAVAQWINGYDTGVKYMDDHVGSLLNLLADQGVLDETAVIVSADHGECLGELNVWGDHQTADDITSRVPLIVKWPGVPARIDHGLHYQVDWAATCIELAGGTVPGNWDGASFSAAFKAGEEAGREYLVLSMGAWSCMRSVRWDDLLCMRVLHDGYKNLPGGTLFDVADDPHEQRDLSGDRPRDVERAGAMLSRWQEWVMKTSRHNIDPMMTVLREGGPWQVRGHLPRYLDRLRATGRGWAADKLEREHAADLDWPESGS